MSTARRLQGRRENSRPLHRRVLTSPTTQQKTRQRDVMRSGKKRFVIFSRRRDKLSHSCKTRRVLSQEMLSDSLFRFSFAVFQEFAIQRATIDA